jgi:hypothetical protein
MSLIIRHLPKLLLLITLSPMLMAAESGSSCSGHADKTAQSSDKACNESSHNKLEPTRKPCTDCKSSNDSSSAAPVRVPYL